MRCEFYMDCSYARDDSYTCTHDGGEYCGEYRKRKAIMEVPC